MSTATIDYEINFQDNQQSEADKRLLVVFYKEAIKNTFKSIEAGRPIFDEVDHVKIMTPGSRDTFTTKVTGGDSEYPLRFPQQWARYKAGQDQEASGTPLNQLPWMSIGQIAELNAVGCKTVEQLVGMSDALSQKFMGHHQLKQRAQVYLDTAKDAAPLLKLQSELETRDEQIAELQATVKGLVEANKAAAKVPLK
jgi:hypothetical protein